MIFSFNSYGQFNIDTIKLIDSQLYHTIKDWVGVNYRIGGNTKNGVDCSGFTKIIYETCYFVKLPRTAKEQYKVTSRIDKDKLLLGDLVFFRTKTRTGWHVGIYLIDGFFLHSINKKYGVKISNLFEPYYVKTYISGGRI